MDKKKFNKVNYFKVKTNRSVKKKDIITGEEIYFLEAFFYEPGYVYQSLKEDVIFLNNLFWYVMYWEADQEELFRLFEILAIRFVIFCWLHDGGFRFIVYVCVKFIFGIILLYCKYIMYLYF